MVATVIAFAAGSACGQEIIGGTLAAPIVAAPFDADGFESAGIESTPLGTALLESAPIESDPIDSAPIVSVDSCSYVGDLPKDGCGMVGMIHPRRYGRPDLFYNYYTQGHANQVNAQMYLSPLPVPPNVGHTFFTYQPFYPEEMLYWHKNRFHRYYDNGRGMNRTRATYYSPPIRQAACNLYWNYLRIPR
jgi:hypothetical protein